MQQAAGPQAAVWLTRRGPAVLVKNGRQLAEPLEPRR
jgi:hypothetical protein